jgi:uncharacterized membrane protein YhhN
MTGALDGAPLPRQLAGMLLVFAACALADWIAVARRWRGLEYVAKPATLLALLAWAATGTPSPWLLMALAFCLLGDVLLMLPSDAFLAGLGSFLVAHLAYIGAFQAPLDRRLTWLLLPLAVSVPILPRLLRAIPSLGLRAAVAIYFLVISIMVASAFASSRPLAAAGAALFVTSDTLIGWNRFVRPASWAPLAIIVTYHLGQLALATALRSG